MDNFLLNKYFVLCTLDCNYSCSFCLNKRLSSKCKFDAEKFLSLYRGNPLPLVTLSGGEPLFDLDNTIKLMAGIKKLRNDVAFQINTNAELLTKELCTRFFENSLLDNLQEFRIGTDARHRPISRFKGEQLEFIKNLYSLGLIKFLFVLTLDDEVANTNELKYIVESFGSTIIEVEYFTAHLLKNIDKQEHFKRIIRNSGYRPSKVKECTTSRLQYECNGDYKICTDVKNLELVEKIKSKDCPTCIAKEYCDKCPKNISRLGKCFCKFREIGGVNIWTNIKLESL